LCENFTGPIRSFNGAPLESVTPVVVFVIVTMSKYLSFSFDESPQEIVSDNRSPAIEKQDNRIKFIIFLQNLYVRVLTDRFGKSVFHPAISVCRQHGGKGGGCILIQAP
jgi:hypothetical protein